MHLSNDGHSRQHGAPAASDAVQAPVTEAVPQVVMVPYERSGGFAVAGVLYSLTAVLQLLFLYGAAFQLTFSNGTYLSLVTFLMKLMALFPLLLAVLSFQCQRRPVVQSCHALSTSSKVLAVLSALALFVVLCFWAPLLFSPHDGTMGSALSQGIATLIVVYLLIGAVANAIPVLAIVRHMGVLKKQRNAWELMSSGIPAGAAAVQAPAAAWQPPMERVE